MTMPSSVVENVMVRSLLILLVVFTGGLQSQRAIASLNDQENDNSQVEYEEQEQEEEEQEPEPRRQERQQRRNPRVLQMQKNLARYGYNPGTIDGIYGPATAAALQAFCRDMRLTNACARIAGSHPSVIEAHRAAFTAQPQTPQARTQHDAKGGVIVSVLLVAAVIIGYIAKKSTGKKEAQTRSQERYGKTQAQQHIEDAQRKYEQEQARRKLKEEHARRSTVNDEIRKCFDVFEMPYSATFDDVKKKYKTMIKLHHPDRHSADDSMSAYADKKTKELNSAFTMLKARHFNK